MFAANIEKIFLSQFVFIFIPYQLFYMILLLEKDKKIKYT